MAIGCHDPLCKRPRAENPKFVFVTLSNEWPDIIVEHCMCGGHNRVVSNLRILKVLADRRPV